MEKILQTLLFTFFVISTPAKAGIIRGLEESYFKRPNILQVEPQPLLNASPAIWKKSLRGHFEVMAMLLEMYPEYDFYFLARDGENLYDLARLMTTKFKDIDPNKLHLVNISRVNMDDSNVLFYLKQEGISTED